MANTFVAFKKSDIRMPESSIRIRSAPVMPWRCAISNTSAMAHSTRSRFGSAVCTVQIRFIVTVYKGLHFCETNAGRVQKCLLRAFFEASQLHLRIPAHPALRIAGARRSQIKDHKQKISNLEVPHCAGTHRPCLLKSAHSCGQTTLSQFIVGKTGLLKNRHPTTDTDRVFRCRHAACPRRLHRCLRDQ